MSTIHAVGQNPEDLHKYIITSCIFIASFIQGSQSALRIFIKTPQKPCKVIQNYSALGSSQPGRPAQGDGSASPRSRPKAAAAAGEEPVPTAPGRLCAGGSGTQVWPRGPRRSQTHTQAMKKEQGEGKTASALLLIFVLNRFYYDVAKRDEGKQCCAVHPPDPVLPFRCD